MRVWARFRLVLSYGQGIQKRMAVVDLRGSLMAGKNRAADFVAGLMLLLTAHLASAALAQEGAELDHRVPS